MLGTIGGIRIGPAPGSTKGYVPTTEVVPDAVAATQQLRGMRPDRRGSITLLRVRRAGCEESACPTLCQRIPCSAYHFASPAWTGLKEEATPLPPGLRKLVKRRRIDVSRVYILGSLPRVTSATSERVHECWCSVRIADKATGLTGLFYRARNRLLRRRRVVCLFRHAMRLLCGTLVFPSNGTVMTQ